MLVDKPESFLIDKPKYAVNWIFSKHLLKVKKLFLAFDYANSKNKSIRISEIPSRSLLHKKRNYEAWNAETGKNSSDANHKDFYMQLLIGDHAIVYDMAGREVAMLNKLK